LFLQFVGGSIIVQVLAILTLQMFPTDLILNDSFVNILAHGIGFIVGSTLPVTTLLSTG